MTSPLLVDVSLAGVAQVGAIVLVGGVLAVLVVAFIWDLLRTRDAQTATERTSRRAGGTLVGAGTLAGTVAVAGVEIVAQIPEVALTLLGAGAIISGWSWDLFLAVAVLVWIGSEAITGGVLDS